MDLDSRTVTFGDTEMARDISVVDARPASSYTSGRLPRSSLSLLDTVVERDICRIVDDHHFLGADFRDDWRVFSISRVDT